MKRQKAAALFFGLLIPFAASASRDELQVEVRVSQWCKELTFEYFWQAYHPGEESRKKVARGTLNEDTPGEALECGIPGNFLGGELFVHTGSLVNSQRGKSIFFAIGYEKEILSYAGFSVSGRFEAMHLEYEVPRLQDWKRGMIPIASLQGSYKFNDRSFGEIGVRHYFLPVDKITLTSFFWKKQF